MESLTVVIPIDQINNGIIEPLTDLLKPDKESNTELFFEIYDPEEKYQVKLFARSHKVNVTKDLIRFIEDNNGLSFKINGISRIEMQRNTEESEDELVLYGAEASA